jgi:hypothetical protein
MSEPIRLRCFMENLYGHSVITIGNQDWQRLVRSDGSPTVVEQIPKKLSGVMRDAEVRNAASRLVSPRGKPKVCSKSLRCVVVARLLESNQEWLKPWAEVRGHSRSLREIMRRFLPNHTLQRTRPVRCGCNPCVPRASSLSLGR